MRRRINRGLSASASFRSNTRRRMARKIEKRNLVQRRLKQIPLSLKED